LGIVMANRNPNTNITNSLSSARAYVAPAQRQCGIKTNPFYRIANTVKDTTHKFAILSAGEFRDTGKRVAARREWRHRPS
jgi:hypothetical protein